MFSSDSCFHVVLGSGTGCSPCHRGHGQPAVEMGLCPMGGAGVCVGENCLWITERTLTALGTRASVGFLESSVKTCSELPIMGVGIPAASKVWKGKQKCIGVHHSSFLPSFLGTASYFLKSVRVKILFRKEAVGGKGQPTGKYRIFHFPFVGWHGIEHCLGCCVRSTHLLTLLLIGGYYSPFC